MTPRVIILRHGETAYNLEPERVRAWMNIPLTAKGRAEAHQVAQTICHIPVAKIYSGDLERTIETAKSVQQACPNKPPIVPTQSLRDWNLGDLQGQTVKATLPTTLAAIRDKNTPIPGGETFNTYLTRFFPAFFGMLNEARTTGNGAIVLSTHNRTVRLVKAWNAAGQNGLRMDESFLTRRENPLGTGEAMVLNWTGRKWALSDPKSVQTTRLDE